MVKKYVFLLAIALGALACRTSGSPTPIPTPNAENHASRSSVRSVEPTDISPNDPDVAPNNAFTLCVTAEEGVWLRSKPWATSALNIPNALLAGTKVEVYLSPYGAHEWLEVYVPSESVTGYVNTNYVGSCKDD